MQMQALFIIILSLCALHADMLFVRVHATQTQTHAPVIIIITCLQIYIITCELHVYNT